ncbi:MAG: malate/L-lactate dehydrogenase family protein [Idiomarinaceae bacterium HL-53]|nr:MAG: malate/L-lactate dehydrogenase family protein [Idiomarinaceae bacterium HL-53]CUS48385.1 Malate/lactate/ureidoglycolate dehydrogenase, LDH2 family [Idiomarinaceae bacterium HL-53]
MNNTSVRIPYVELKQWAIDCFAAAGAPREMAEAMAETLIQGDLLGFSTHGLRRLPYNIKRIVLGEANVAADLQVIKQKLAVETWDAHTLPGIYVARKAVARACELAKAAGSGTIVVRRADHVACLAAYLEQATSQGLVISLMASTPAQESVAPFGSVSRVFSPNPFAMGVPTSSQPLLLDMSFSMTAAGKVRQAYDRSELLPFAAVITAQGEATREPSAYIEGDGALLPLGGMELGYKGYGLCLMSEIWTMALSNYGRAQATEDGERNSLFVQVYDPEAFGSLDSFLAVTDDLITRCRASRPVDETKPVRIPGEKGLALREQQMKEGVELDSLTWEKLKSCSARLNVTMPKTNQ